MAKDQRGVQKNTSLQAWSKLTEQYFNRKLRVEERKDREHIYSLLKQMNLPYERFHAFSSGDKLTKDEFLSAVGDLGFPYWISATPKVGITDLNRMSKLRIESPDEGWDFIQALPRLEDYKIIVMQYADDPEYKGTVVVSQNLNGIADFVKGDKHVQLTSGLTLSDPMLFDSQKIIHYSETTPEKYQDLVYSYVANLPGHFEFQYGILDRERGLSFFDYNDELAYEDIDSLFQDLVLYHDINLPENGNLIVKGLPASLGQAEGNCRVIMSSDYQNFHKVKEGEILISDATTPEMTPVMKKVVAIVTDFGGVTSHAAIVCRELGIPCIVGAKDATSKLKDGMKVRVDAFKGVIKLL